MFGSFSSLAQKENIRIPKNNAIVLIINVFAIIIVLDELNWQVKKIEENKREKVADIFTNFSQDIDEQLNKKRQAKHRLSLSI